MTTATEQLALFDVRTTPWGSVIEAPTVATAPEVLPRPQRIHWNSREGLAESKRDLSARAMRILTWFGLGARGTDRDCRDALFGTVADMNTVRPRITELVDDGLLEEIGRVADPVSGKQVRVCRITRRGMEEIR